MKDELKNSSLGQKRSEWHITDDAQTDWQQMQGILDTHMPVVNTAPSTGAESHWSSKLARLGKLKLWVTMAVTISAAVLTVHHFTHKPEVKHQTKLKPLERKIDNNNRADTLNNIPGKLIVDSGKIESNTITDNKIIDGKETKNDQSRKNEESPFNNNTSGASSNTNPPSANRTNTQGSSKLATPSATAKPSPAANNVLSVKNNKVTNPATDKSKINKTANPSNKIIGAISRNRSVAATINRSSKSVLTNPKPTGTRGQNSGANNAAARGNIAIKYNKVHSMPHLNGTILSHTNAGITKIKTNHSSSKSGSYSPVKTDIANAKSGATAKNSPHRVSTGLNNTNVRKSTAINTPSIFIKNSGHARGANKTYAFNKNGANKKGLTKPLNWHRNNNSPSRYNALNTGFNKSANQPLINASDSEAPLKIPSKNNVLVSVVPKPSFIPHNQPLLATILLVKPSQIKPSNTSLSDKKDNDQKIKPKNTSGLDWGVLMGVNQSGSFTSKSQNANFYGSLPVDMYFGLFATYNIQNHWGVNLQVSGLSPQTVSGTYSRANASKLDSGQISIVTDSRKVYFVDIPLHLVYRPIPHISLVAGAILSIPVKDAFANTNLDYGKAHKDSAYYATVTNQANATKYNKTINVGVSGGIVLQYSRLILQASYIKSFTPQSISSDLGNYSFNYNTLQFTLGIKLNKPK